MEEKKLETQSGFIRPLLSVDQAVEAFNQYQALKTKLRGEGDFIAFTDHLGNVKEAPTKSWRSKLTRFFGISVEIVSETTEQLADGSFVVKVIAKAIAPNGLFMFGDGACWSKTKNEKDRRGNPIDIYHNTRSHAITRAKNRAVLELVGFGEVSAEEINSEFEEIGNTKTYQPPNYKTTKTTSEPSKKITEKQIKYLYVQAKQKGMDSEALHKLVNELYGIEHLNELDYVQFNFILDELAKMGGEK